MRRVAVALVASMAATPLLAQMQINMNSQLAGVLTVSSPQWQDGARYNTYTFMGQAGQTVAIAMNSTAFDPLLILQDQMGTEIARDDDSGEGVNALLTATLRTSGVHRIIAKAYRADLFGNYTIAIAGSNTGVAIGTPQPMNTPTNMAGPTQAGQIGANQQVTGNLSGMDGRWDGRPAHSWAFACTAGQAVQMDVLSSWDNYAVIFDALGNEAARDDDSGPLNLDARINHTCAMTGVYRLLVTTFTSSTTPGQYTLQVQAMTAPVAMQPQPMGTPQPMVGTPQPMNPTPITQPQAMAPGATMPTAVPNNMAITGSIPAPGTIGVIALGTNMQGRLETGDQQMNDGTWADVWNFTGTQGQRIRIELRSEEFDTYLQLLDSRGTMLSEDDDALGNLDSMVEVVLPASGTYQIVVNNVSDERRAGIYTLTVR